MESIEKKTQKKNWKNEELLKINETEPLVGVFKNNAKILDYHKKSIMAKKKSHLRNEEKNAVITNHALA